jgi:hypothetical protein
MFGALFAIRSHSIALLVKLISRLMTLASVIHSRQTPDCGRKFRPIVMVVVGIGSEDRESGRRRAPGMD